MLRSKLASFVSVIAACGVLEVTLQWHFARPAYEAGAAIADTLLSPGALHTPGADLLTILIVEHLLLSLPVTVAGLLMFMLLTRRRENTSASNCVRCGYDLRGTFGCTCPECGAATTVHRRP